ncbi:MAG: PrpR N-terminal domain-containing protein [Oscillospiraceae bacterium]|nr:PrpR N-terminal domain-containing protein [Oscillospiraceae bacterium]
MEKVKVLAVVPYENMKIVLDSIVAARDDIDLTTVVSYSEQAVSYVRHCDQSSFDVIISRGGTAEMIQEYARIPVIEIELTPYDIRSALAAVSGSGKRIAIMGFPSIVEAAASLCDILGIAVETATIHKASEAKPLLRHMAEEGIELFLCDMVGMEAASELDLSAVLITSGAKGITAALNKAVLYYSSHGRAKLAAAIYEAELLAKGENLAVLNAGGQTLFASPNPSIPPALRKVLCRMVPAVLNDGKIQVSRPAGNTEYAIEANAISYEGEACAAFRYCGKGQRLPVSTPGVRFYDSSEADMMRVSRHYGEPGSRIMEQAEKIAQSGLPTIVTGERGTLAKSVAGYIAMNGLLSERDCCIIDCSAVTAKGWSKLLGNSGLLSFQTGSTVLFDQVMETADRELEDLIDFLQSSDISRQLRMVFVITAGVYPARENAVIKLLRDRLYCVVMNLPPLRKRGEAIKSVIENCVTAVCADMGIRAPRIEENGLRLLTEFSWPRNYQQLYRVMTQLIADGRETISGEQIQTVLESEKAKISFYPESQESISLSGTLEDISRRVVLRVLAEENMNRSRTARRLGISRATLWRVMNREAE